MSMTTNSNAKTRWDPITDHEWHADHSTRRYRVRAWRVEDGHSSNYSLGCLSVIDFRTGRILSGWPADSTAEDSDRWAAATFAVNDRLCAGFRGRRV